MGDTIGGTLGGTRGSMRDTFAARNSMRGSIRNRGQGGGNVKNIAGEVLTNEIKFAAVKALQPCNSHDNKHE